MDSLDLLAREDEFKRLNRELEKKSDSLMKQIEHAMQKQDFFSEFSTLTLSPQHINTRKHSCSSKSTPELTPIKTKARRTPKSSPKHEINSVQQSLKADDKNVNSRTEENDNSNSLNQTCCSKRHVCGCCAMSRQDRVNGDLEFLYAFVSVSVQEHVLPQSFMKDRVTVESICKFLSSKVKLMQEQIETLQTTINKKASQCEVHLSHQAELEGERMALLNAVNSAKAAAVDLRAKAASLQRKLDEKDRLYKEQRSETDRLFNEAKQLRVRTAAAEARAAAQEHTATAHAQQLNAARAAERDLRESTRSLTASHQAAISQLEARVKTLCARADKQAELIDNLRKQNSLLAVDGAVKALEKEYNDFLTKDF